LSCLVHSLEQVHNHRMQNLLQAENVYWNKILSLERFSRRSGLIFWWILLVFRRLNWLVNSFILCLCTWTIRGVYFSKVMSLTTMCVVETVTWCPARGGLTLMYEPRDFELFMTVPNREIEKQAQTSPKGNSGFCFPEMLNVPRGKLLLYLPIQK